MRKRGLILILAGCCLLPAVVWAADSTPAHSTALGEQTVIGSVRLQLTARGQTCHVSATSKAEKTEGRDMGMPWPCHFHKGKDGKIRVVRNGKYGHVLVEASKPNPAGGKDCETHLRAIQVAGKKWKVSEHQDKVASCPPFQWDEMVFAGLFK